MYPPSPARPAGPAPPSPAITINRESPCNLCSSEPCPSASPLPPHPPRPSPPRSTRRRRARRVRRQGRRADPQGRRQRGGRRGGHRLHPGGHLPRGRQHRRRRLHDPVHGRQAVLPRLPRGGAEGREQDHVPGRQGRGDREPQPGRRQGRRRAGHRDGPLGSPQAVRQAALERAADPGHRLRAKGLQGRRQAVPVPPGRRRPVQRQDQLRRLLRPHEGRRGVPPAGPGEDPGAYRRQGPGRVLQRPYRRPAGGTDAAGQGTDHPPGPRRLQGQVARTDARRLAGQHALYRAAAKLRRDRPGPVAGHQGKPCRRLQGRRA